MTKSAINATEVMLSAQRREGKRSPLFLWMLEHHDEIVATLQGGRIGWGPFCAAVAEAGLKDTTGKAPSENTARITWYRVRRLAARQHAARTAAGDRAPAAHPSRPPPSKMPQDARPLEANAHASPAVDPSPASNFGPARVVAEPPKPRPLKVFRSLEDIKPWKPPPDPDPAPVGGDGVLPPPTWPKPVM
jgi:hypothetical protein